MHDLIGLCTADKKQDICIRIQSACSIVLKQKVKPCIRCLCAIPHFFQAIPSCFLIHLISIRQIVNDAAGILLHIGHTCSYASKPRSKAQRHGSRTDTALRAYHGNSDTICHEMIMRSLHFQFFPLLWGISRHTLTA